MPSKGAKGVNNIRGLARLITSIESRDKAALRELARLSGGKVRVLGITGPPGAGKSTLADCVIKHLRKKGARVGVVAIDPSSPFSGGALLGDRIRMQGHAGDSGVFIRSVGSRGSHGGLSRATRDIVRAMAAYGMEYIIVETVGVGQTELDIMEIADVTVVVLVPESGDMIQTMKAGLLEIADIFVVNKADRSGAEQMKIWLTSMFDIGVGLDAEAIKHHGDLIPPLPATTTLAGRKKGGEGGFKDTPVLLTQANKGEGVDELMDKIGAGFEFAKNNEGRKKRKRQILRQEFFDMCAEEFKERLISKSARDKNLKALLTDIENGKKAPYEALKVIDKLVKIRE